MDCRDAGPILVTMTDESPPRFRLRSWHVAVTALLILTTLFAIWFQSVFANGILVRGANAYRWMLPRRWWDLPIWCVVVIPPGRWLCDLAYRWFARNRDQVSHVCGLKPPSAS